MASVFQDLGELRQVCHSVGATLDRYLNGDSVSREEFCVVRDSLLHALGVVDFQRRPTTGTASKGNGPNTDNEGNEP